MSYVAAKACVWVVGNVAHYLEAGDDFPACNDIEFAISNGYAVEKKEVKQESESNAETEVKVAPKRRGRQPKK